MSYHNGHRVYAVNGEVVIMGERHKKDFNDREKKIDISVKVNVNKWASLSGIGGNAIKTIFQVLESLPCTSVAFALTHPNFYKYRKATYGLSKDLYIYNPPLTIRTPSQLLYVVIKEFMGNELHFCYARRKFIPWSRRGMTIAEKKLDRCPLTKNKNSSCGIYCGDYIGPLASD